MRLVALALLSGVLAWVVHAAPRRLRLAAQVVLALALAELGVSALWAVGWRPGVQVPDVRVAGEAPWQAPDGRRSPLPVGVLPDGPSDLLPDPALRRILFLGDSFTAGLGVHPSERFAEQAVAELLRRGLPVEVRVAGVPGIGLVDAVPLYLDGLARQAPDVVVWVLLPNDFGGGFPDGASAYYDDLVNDTLDRARPPSRLVDLVSRALTARARSERVVASYEAALRDPLTRSDLLAGVAAMSAEVEGRGGRFVVVMFPFLHALDAYPLRDAQAALLDAVRATGVEVVDLLPAFEGRSAASLWVASEDHHPNAAGHALAAERLAAVLATDLPEAAPARCPPPPAPYDAVVGGAGERAALCEAPTSPEAWLALAARWEAVPDHPERGAALVRWFALAHAHVLAAGTPQQAAVNDEVLRRLP